MQALAKESDRSTRRQPERQCIVCGRKGSPEWMLRVVATPDGGAALDWRRSLGGRGAHLCPARRCVESACKKGLLARALRAEIGAPPAAEALIDAAKQAAARQLATLIRQGLLARRLGLGADTADTALRRGQARALVIAEGAAPRAALTAEAARRGVPVVGIESKATFGALVGRGELGAAAVLDDGLAQALIRIASRVEGLA